MHQLTRPAHYEPERAKPNNQSTPLLTRRVRFHFFTTETALHKTGRGTAPDGSLKNVESGVLQRMAFNVFTARDPRQRQRTAILDRMSCAHGVTRLENPRCAMGY